MAGKRDQLLKLRHSITGPRLVRWLLFAALPASVFYFTALLSMHSLGFSVVETLRDMVQSTGESSLLGFISNMGFWLWVSTIAICLFHGLTKDRSIDPDVRELLLLLAGLSLLLAVDDFFLIHDRYIEQNYCYAAYALLAILLLYRHYENILRIDGFAFGIAGTLLFCSILVDLTRRGIPMAYHHQQIIEEGFKFCGAASWLYFGCLASMDSRR